MKTHNAVLAALLLAASATTGQAGNLYAAYMEPVVTAPAGVAGISVSVCSDEPGQRRGCDGGGQRAAFFAGDRDGEPSKTGSGKGPKGGGKEPKGDKTPTGMTPTTGNEAPTPEAPPVDRVVTETCETCDDWRREYEWKRENKPWQDNPKWSADAPRKSRPNRGESMWDHCIGEDRRAARRG